MSPRPEKFAFIDLEFSHNNPKKASILQIAVITPEGGVFYRTPLTRPDTANSHNLKVAGYDPDLWARSQVGLKTALVDLLALTRGCHLVGHHIQSDLAHLHHHIQDLGLDHLIAWRFPAICTGQVATQALPGLHSYSLKHIAKVMGIHNPQAHHAWYDTMTCKAIFERLWRPSLLDRWIFLPLLRFREPPVDRRKPKR